MTDIQIVALAAIVILVTNRFLVPFLVWCTPIGARSLKMAEHCLRWTFSSMGRVARLSFSGILLLSVMAINIYLFGITSDLPDLAKLINYRPVQTGYFRDVDGEVVMEMAMSYRDLAAFEEFPPILKMALMASEDKRFFDRSHVGVDFLAWARVAYMKATGGKRQGGSTLDQQLTRKVYLEELLACERSDTLCIDNAMTRTLAWIYDTRTANAIARKTREVKYALYIRRGLTDYFLRNEASRGWYDALRDGPHERARRAAQEHIFMCYANEIYLGNGVSGFSYASERYFGKPMAELTSQEAALLVSFIPYPGPFARLTRDLDDLESKRRRRNEVLRRMHRNGFIDRLEFERAQQSSVRMNHPVGGSKTSAPAVVNLALREVEELGVSHKEILDGFANPHMTMDLDVQDAVNRSITVLHDRFDSWWPTAEKPQIAVVVLGNRDARVLALYGGTYDDSLNNYSWFNRATQSIRQPGSAFKGIVMAAALRSGHTIDGGESTFWDVPMRISMGNGKFHTPRNYDGTFSYKKMNLREIVAQSRNIPTLRISNEITADKIIETARMFGITTDMEAYPTTALGAYGVRLIEFANAYRAMASGVLADPYVVSRVMSEKGDVIATRDVQTRPVPMRPSQLLMLQELLRGTILIPGGTGGQLRNTDFCCAVAGKTGTSNEHRDNLFVGFTYGLDGITILAWVGYDEYLKELPHKSRPRATGATTALIVVREIFESVYGEGNPLGHPPRFPRLMEESIRNYVESKNAEKEEK